VSAVFALAAGTLHVLRGLLCAGLSMTGLFRPWWAQRMRAATLAGLALSAGSASLAAFQWAWQSAQRAAPAVDPVLSWGAAAGGCALLFWAVWLVVRAAGHWRQATSRAHGARVEKTARAAAKRALRGRWTVRERVPLPGRREDADLVILAKRGIASLWRRSAAPVLCVVEIKSWTTWRLTDPRCEKATDQNARQKHALRARAAILWLPQARSQPPVAVARDQWVVLGDAHALRQMLELLAKR
jgi:hypothetical protein